MDRGAVGGTDGGKTKSTVLMWVKGHDGVEGNEAPDGRTEREVWMGERIHWPDIVTPADIRQAFPLHSKALGHPRWTGVALWGLTYLITDKGPQRQQWLKEIGKVEDPSVFVAGGLRRMRLTLHMPVGGR